MESRTVAQSRVTVSYLMSPEHANPLGRAHGGEIMKKVDEVGGLAAMRHAHCPTVTVAIDAMTFMQPVSIGHLLTMTAEVTYVGRTSLEVRVSVIAEDPLSGQRVHTNWAYLVYVAIDATGRPTEVPPLVAETEEEQIRMERASERQKQRLARSKQEMTQIHNG